MADHKLDGTPYFETTADGAALWFVTCTCGAGITSREDEAPTGDAEVTAAAKRIGKAVITDHTATAE